MTKIERQGPDVIAMTAKLEDAFLERVRFPGGKVVPPEGRADAIRKMAMDRWTAHAAPHVIVSEERRSGDKDEEREIVGISLALLEIYALEVTSTELAEIECLRQAASIQSIPARLRSELFALAAENAATLISRAFIDHSRGRPKCPLVDAATKQLQAAGLTYRRIAKLTGCTEGAARWRCNREDRRSLASFFPPCPQRPPGRRAALGRRVRSLPAGRSTPDTGRSTVHFTGAHAYPHRGRASTSQEHCDDSKTRESSAIPLECHRRRPRVPFPAASPVPGPSQFARTRAA